MIFLNRPLYYLASPFTHTQKEIMRMRTEIAIDVSIKLVNADYIIFSPIAYNGSWIDKGVRGDWEFWKEFDLKIISKCEGVIVLTMPGWENSVGVTEEVEFAKEMAIPVYYLSPEQANNSEFSHIPK